MPSAWITSERQEYVRVGDVGMQAVVLEVASYDPVSQLLSKNSVRLATDGIAMSPIVLWLVTPSELDLMARIADLRLVARFANWRREPFSVSSRAHVSIYQAR